MHDLQDLIPPLAQWLGVEPATLLLFIGIAVAIANLLGRLIPDDATGFLGVVRKLSKVIGLYTSNRIASGITVNEVAKTTMPIIEQFDDQIAKAEERLAVIKAFPGLPERDPVTGQFKKKESE